MLRRLYFVLLPLLLLPVATAQTPVAMPYTMTTVSGNSPMSGVTGTQCPGLPAGVTSTDAYGDGCLAVNGIYGATARAGVVLDSYGNIFVGDDQAKVLHMINPTTGIMTKLAGLGTSCGTANGAYTSAGDGCVAATNSVVNGQRGIGIDPWGNVLQAGYGDGLLHVVCRVVSPICTAAQIGTMQMLGGCVATVGGASQGSSNTLIGISNAPGKVVGSSCASGAGVLAGPRGVAVDIYGNIFFADTSSTRFRVIVGPQTSSFFSGTNPLYATLGVLYPSVTAGYAYTVVNTQDLAACGNTYSNACGGQAAAPTAAGLSCAVTTNSTTYTGTSTDVYGDGCPFNFSYIASNSGYTSGVAVDAAGNMLFADPGRGLRVLFVSGAGTAGAAMAHAISVNNGSLTPHAGFIYMLAGAGTTAVSATPVLGNSTSAFDSSAIKLTVSPQGNIYVADGNRVLFYDMSSGYLRTLITGSSNVTLGNHCTGTTGQVSLSAYSDGCPASLSLFTNGAGPAVDLQGNLYLFDSTSNPSGMLVRKVLAQGLAEQTLGTPLIQTMEVHFPEAASGTVTGSTTTLSTASDIGVTSPSCVQNADKSVDCTATVTATPSAAGIRSATLTFALPSGTWENSSATIALGGAVTGSVLAFDNASTTTTGTTTPVSPSSSAVFTGITPAGVAVDGAGNVYAASGKSIVESIGGTTYTLTTSLPSVPSQIAVDQTGNVFAAGSGTSAVEELMLTAAGSPATYTLVSIPYTPASGTATPKAIAVDQAGNLFVADYQSTGSSIYRLSLVPGTLQFQTTIASGLGNPVSLAVDGSGNIYVDDIGTSAVYKLTPGVTGTYTQTTLLSSAASSVAVDAAGDLYIQAGTSILEVPLSGPQTTVLTGLSTPTGLAVDGKGNVYSADAANTSITKLVRDAVSYNFGTSETKAFAGTLTNVGNQSITGSNTVTNTINFAVTGGSSNACALSNSILGALAAGNACTLSATLVGSGSGVVTDALTFLPAASTVGSLTLTGTLQGVAVATTTTISAPTPSAPVYSASGTEVSFTINVAAATGSSAPAGTVAVTVDSTTTNPSLTTSGTNGTAMVTLTGLAAGQHTISAIYNTSGSFTGSNSGTPKSFAIAQQATLASWTPASTTLQVSQALGTGVLNASATPSIAGNFVYTATPSGGSAIGVDASTYLPIGTYSLATTFYPNDANDYASSSTTVSSFSVTMANTNASAGASTNVVAADGTANYTTLSAALAALPVTGGTIYLKPGTYTGQNAISYPNVSLRGLGGDPTKVVLTAEDGAFSGPFPVLGYLGTGIGSGNANASGDEGSSTLNVAKGTYMGQSSGSTATPIGVQNATSYTPNNFYAEYLTVQNTWDTDPNTFTTVYYNGSSCLTGPSTSLQALWAQNQACAGQALAMWITADQAIMNNVNLASQQDTILAGSQGCGSTCTAARQYMWKGMITGSVDYIWGDAALVMDHTNIFTTWHGSATGSETITAQNKHFESGSAGDYLSGYICNGCTLMSQSTGMTGLTYGRPYGPYSTWILLNSYVDQVSAVGWIEFSGDTNLPTSTYAEYNTQPFTDPPVGTGPYPATIFGGAETPTGGNTGAGVTGTRETTSADPGTLEAANSNHTSLTAAEAAQYYPVTFLSATVPAQTYSGFTANWNPVTALATAVNSFAPSGNVALTSYGSSVTILGRPQTPGAGVIPTGSYTFKDSLNGAPATTLAFGTLDASGEAYLITSTLATGTHAITMIYGGDSNFGGSTSSPFNVTVPLAPLTATKTSLAVTNPSITYGGTVSGSVTVAPQTGTGTPTGNVSLMSGSITLGSCTLAGGTCTYTVPSIAAGVQTITANYGGDTSFATSSSTGTSVNVARAILQVVASNATTTVGGALPSFTYTINGFVGSDTQSSAVTGSPTLATTATGTTTAGTYPISITTGSLAASNYNFTFTSGYLSIAATSQAPAVATGDTRNITEPIFPGVCQQLSAGIMMVNNDIPDAIENPNTTPGVSTNPDGARIQAALNACSANNPGLAVQLSVDNAGHNAFLSGPLTIPSNVTLLVDPAVVLFFSRNAQDYDVVPGVHQCGNLSTASNVCQSLVTIPSTATNVGIMGYGKMDARSGDVLINPVPPYQGYSWWELAADYVSPEGAQVPPFVTVATGATNVTFYKITIRNSPNRHIGDGAMNSLIWGVKLVSPTTARNSDGIDTGNSNITITRSWISEGDDNVAIGATHQPANNISVTHNHFFAGHGESIGSYTGSGVSNVLFDSNISAGNGFAGYGSAVSSSGTFAGGASDSNSTAIRVKTANDRGGLVTNIQYSNSCFLDHAIDVEFTPYYSTGDATTQFPSYQHFLMQNLVFQNEASSSGSEEYDGEYNTNINTTTGVASPITNPLTATLDNVTFPSTLTSLTNTTTPYETWVTGSITNYSGGLGQYAALTYGPGQVSSNFVSLFGALAAVPANHDSATDSRTATSLQAPSCVYTYIAPELTGPTGLPQTITFGQNATAIAIMTPAVGGAAYPTGTVTLTDALTSTAYTATLPGNTDTISIPLSGLSVGTHTLTATYSGDTNYKVPNGATSYTSTAPYVITVNAGSLSSTTTALSGVPSTSAFGNAVTAIATVTGTSPTGTVQFIVSGGGATGSYTYATATVVSGTASASISLSYSTTAYSITAIYSGDTVNAGSTSAASALTVGLAATVTTLAASTTNTSLGHPVSLNASVSSVVSAAGIPAGTVTFSYTTASSSTAVSIASATLSAGTASASADLPVGTNYVIATYVASGNYAGSTTGSPITVTVNLPAIIPLSSSPIALPYTITNIAGGSGLAIPSTGNMACAGATDKYGDGCLGTAMAFTTGDDMRGVSADPYGNVYVTDISAARVRRISPNGVITTFAGGGTTCTSPASTSAVGTGCTPTLASLSRPRGVSADAAGNVFIADYGTGKIYEVKIADGLMYLVAGNGTSGAIGDGGPASAAELASPRSAWSDSVGNIYIADTTNEKVRVVDTVGNIHTFAGTGTNSSTGDGGLATSATISTPQGVTVDANLNVYVTDAGKVRVICVTCGTNSPLDAVLGKLGISAPTNGYIYTIAGSGTTSVYSGTLPTKSTNVSMSPQKLAMDTSGNLYISDSNGFIWLVDFHTGYIRAVASAASTVCSGATDTYGDGCPATQAKFGSNGGNGFGVGTDALGNVYISDTTNLLIRKVVTGLVSTSTATAATFSQHIELHFTAGDNLASSNGLAFPSTEWTLGTPSCTTNADTTTDCLVSSGFTPAIPGLRTTPFTVTSSAGNTANLSLKGVGLGAGATLDPATQISFGKNLQVAGLAIDMTGNVYVADSTSKSLLRFTPAAVAQGASAASTTLATLTAPGAIAIDPRGFVYVADTSTGLITQVSPTGTAVTLPFTFSHPSGLTTDALNNLYVADSAAKVIYEIDPMTGAEHTLISTGLTAPAGLSMDPSGNLLIADPGAPALYRYSQLGILTTVSTSAVAPFGVVTDAAGNVLIADTASILAVPASKNSAGFNVSATAPASLAIDSAGNLYTGSAGGVLKLVRTQGYVQFATGAGSQTVDMLDSGNQILQATSISRTDTSDYGLSPTASTDCTLNSGGTGTLAVGGVCAFAASYTPTTSVTTTDTATVNGNLMNAALSTPSSVQLVLTGPVTAPAATVAIAAFSPASPVYGQSIIVTATVTSKSVEPTGSVVFTVDGSNINAAVTNGVASATLTGLLAGSHSVSAAYTSSNGYPSANSSTSSLVVSPAPLMITAFCSNRVFGQPNVCVANVTGSYAYTDSVSTVFTVVPAATTTATSSSVAGSGYVATLVYTLSTFGAANYVVTPVNGSFTISGGAPQTILFAPLPNLAHNASYQLTARTTSGLPVTYTVTAGSASINGDVLTVNGAGLVTVQASQSTDPTGDYASATPVSRSFTAP